MIKVAVYVTIGTAGGGSCQYVETVIDALLHLPKDKYALQIWHTQPDWKERLLKKNVSNVYIDKKMRRRGWLRPLQELSRLAGKYFPWGKRARKYIQSLQDPLPLLLKKWQPDIVFVPQDDFLDIPLRYKQINIIHDLMHRYEPSFPEVGTPEIIKNRDTIYANCCARSAAVLVDSAVGKQHVIESYACAPQKIHVVPFTMPQSLLEATPSRPAGLPGELDRNYLFYPAQLWLHKNHRNLLKAVSLLRPDLEIPCVFVGGINKNGYATYLEAVDRLGLQSQVFHLGYVSEAELAFLYKHARCMVMPTFFGPTNIPPLEAMAFGCPVAVSRIYGMPEQLKNAALYFDPNSARDMAETIRSLWLDKDVRAKLIEKGHACVQEKSDSQFEANIKKIIQAITER